MFPGEDFPWSALVIGAFAALFIVGFVSLTSHNANEKDTAWDDNIYLRQIRQDIRLVAYLLIALIILIGAAAGLISGLIFSAPA